jgi:deoxyribonuclease-4
MAGMPATEPRLGIHLALANGMARAADRAVELGLAAVQVFGDNPTAYRRRAAPPSELAAFRARLAGAGVEPIAIHASYLVNPAGADPVHRERSVELLAAELETASGFGATIVTVHIGSHGGAGAQAGIRAVVDVVARARAAAEASGATELPVVALENSAGGGFALGVDVAELAAIADAFDERGLGRGAVAFCLDAAHAWAAGIDMADPRAIDALLEALDRGVGLDRLRLVHLNDSATGLGSRSDRHQHLGAGRIGPLGLGHLVRHPRLGETPFILETPGMEVGYDAVNLARARALVRGESLADLPPEAFELLGGRTRAAAPPPDDLADVDARAERGEHGEPAARASRRSAGAPVGTTPA